MVVAQGDILWADLGEARGSEAAFDRPVVVIQGNRLNQSRLMTIVCVPLTGNLNWSDAPSSVTLTAKSTGLDRDSVAQVHQVTAIDRAQLGERIGRISERHLAQIFGKLDLVLGR